MNPWLLLTTIISFWLLTSDLDFYATFCRAECGFDDAVINKKYANKIESVATWKEAFVRRQYSGNEHLLESDRKIDELSSKANYLVIKVYSKFAKIV